MREKYLGDSYDLVKRFWADSLRSVAPLLAHPQFVREGIREQYTALTSIPVLELDKPPEGPFGLLLDPDTGIPLPAEPSTEASASHAPLPFIVRVNATLRPVYMICFDQSFHRRPNLDKAAQLEMKRKFLKTTGIDSFYYNSHAPFLFMADRSQCLSAVKERLISLGVPPHRFVLRAKR